jgi:hypothetical protein
MPDVTVDFVARDQPHGGWALVLVEEGPWTDDEIEAQLRRVQARLYTCLDAVLDGQVAERFPDSKGAPLAIRLEAHDVPRRQLEDFFHRFSTSVPKLPEFEQSMRNCSSYPAIHFELRVTDIPHAS